MDLLLIAWLAYQVLALFVVLYLVFHIAQIVIKILYGYFYCYYFCTPPDLKKSYGEWAVVTGGSHGIGKFYAIELAKRKMNVVLVSRSEEKLKAVARGIEEAYGVRTKTVAADLGQGREATDKVWREIAGLDVGILMNNAATTAGLPNYFANLARSDMWNLYNLNMAAVTDLAHLVLPGMKSRRRGLIVNVSSVAAISPNPFSSIYAASKAYVTSFSEALRVECAEFGVEVQTIAPGYVATGFIDGNKHLLPGFLDPTPEKYAKSAVATIGFMGHCSGFWAHEAQSASLEILPIGLRKLVMTLYVHTKKYNID